MKMLDLFAGLGGWSEPWRARGHDVLTLDFDPRFGTDIVADILEFDPIRDLPAGWRPDVVLASPPCEAFSVLTIGRNWTKAPEHAPKTDAARLALRIAWRTRELLGELAPAFFVVENPVAKLRRLPPFADLERRTVTYCRLGEPFRKPTDLWGGFPPSLDLPEPCKVTRQTAEVDGFTWALGADGEPCHVSAPRGSTTGIQGDGVVDMKNDRRGSLTQTKRIHRQMREGEYTEGPRPKPGNERTPTRDGEPPWLRARAHASAKHYGTWDKPTLAALRAKIPAALSTLVLDACERDLAAGLTHERRQTVLF